MGTPGPRPVVLDAGALIEFDRGAERMRALVRLARQRAVPLIVPAGALAQAWRDGRRQARLAALVGAPDTRIDVLDEMDRELGPPSPGAQTWARQVLGL